MLEAPIRLNLDSIFASDVQGHARAYQSLTTAGMDSGIAAQIAGVTVETA